MIVATSRGDGIDLARTPISEWSTVQEELESKGRIGRKRLVMLILRLGHDVPSRTIAEALGLSEGHVRREIRNAKAALRKKLPDGKKASAIAR